MSAPDPSKMRSSADELQKVVDKIRSRVSLDGRILGRTGLLADIEHAHKLLEEIEEAS